MFRFLLVLIICLFISTSDSSAGPLKRFIQKRKAAVAACPCGTSCQCAPGVCAQGNCPQQSFYNPPQFFSLPGGPVIQGQCPGGVCPVPQSMPKLK